MISRQLADYLKNSGVVRDESILEAFKSIDRREFVPKDQRQNAYFDQPLAIGYGQTISQPYTVALMLDFLEIKSGQKILDIGSGSGWTTALLAQVVGPKGQVIGVERIPELVKLGQENLAKYNFSWANIVQATSGTLGIPDNSPFDRILVSAEAHTVPNELIDQLNKPGVLVLPLNGPIIKVRKDQGGQLTQEKYKDFLFAFVPLIKQ